MKASLQYTLFQVKQPLQRVPELLSEFLNGDGCPIQKRKKASVNEGICGVPVRVDPIFRYRIVRLFNAPHLGSAHKKTSP